eukprot:5498026-Pleurochrysis_carterae.AAC.1
MVRHPRVRRDATGKAFCRNRHRMCSRRSALQGSRCCRPPACRRSGRGARPRARAARSSSLRRPCAV